MKNQSAWWSKESHFTIFDSAAFIEHWKSEVLNSACSKTKSKNQVSALQLLSDQTKNLWKSFTLERSELDRDYMSQEKYFTAYLASFFIPNIERTRQIFMQPRAARLMSELCKKEVIEVLDFGSGPLSSSIGLLIALDQTIQMGKTASKLKNIKITAVERSEKAVETAKSWLQKHLLNQLQADVTRLTSAPKNTSYDVILAANVFNEIPKKHQFTTLKNLLSCLHKTEPHQTSQLLIIEPGQEGHAKGLSALRDAVVHEANLSHIQIEAPCLHRGDCPLSDRSQRRDWCWFKGQFERPEFLAELDRRTEIDHSSLAYSYLLLSNSPCASPKKGAIAVSDEMQLAGEDGKDARYQFFKNNRVNSPKTEDTVLLQLANSCTKLKLCTSDGELLAGLSLSTNTPSSRRRGSQIESMDDFDCLVQER